MDRFSLDACADVCVCLCVCAGVCAFAFVCLPASTNARRCQHQQLHVLRWYSISVRARRFSHPIRETKPGPPVANAEPQSQPKTKQTQAITLTDGGEWCKTGFGDFFFTFFFPAALTSRMVEGAEIPRATNLGNWRATTQ